MPVVAFFSSAMANAAMPQAGYFRKGLSEMGFSEGRNVTIEYHGLEGRFERLPTLLDDVIRRRVAVIATPGSNPASLAAKAATATIPVVFGVGDDPVTMGLVASLARPGGNATGVNWFSQEVTAKRLRLLHDVVPKAVRVAVLVNPGNATSTEVTVRETQKAAPALGLQIQVLNASTIDEIEAAFAAMARERADALYVASDAFYNNRRGQIATLAARDRISASYSTRDTVEVGGLMSYGADIHDMFRQVGIYTGRSPERREACRLAGAAVDQVRVHPQPANGAGARNRRAAGRALDRRRGDRMKRRAFITLLGGAAAAWPLAARAQQPAVPVVGFLSPIIRTQMTPAFLQALGESGFVEGRTVEFDFRWGAYDQLPALAEELVRRRVAVIRAGSPQATRAAMMATSTIPIVFGVGEDPVKEGLIASLGRPGGNVTGFANFANQLVAKRLELVHELVPQAKELGFLANPVNPNFGPDTADVQTAADALGLRVHVLTGSTERELEAAFAGFKQQRLDAMMVGVDTWYRTQPELIAALAARHGVITTYERRSFAVAGGLMSYGTDSTEAERQFGLYVARILKGAKPADLPVQQATKFELIVNLKTAKALGFDVPTSILLRATEVIE